jgi:hypothetical protein
MHTTSIRWTQKTVKSNHHLKLYIFDMMNFVGKPILDFPEAKIHVI